MSSHFTYHSVLDDEAWTCLNILYMYKHTVPQHTLALRPHPVSELAPAAPSPTTVAAREGGGPHTTTCRPSAPTPVHGWPSERRLLASPLEAGAPPAAASIATPPPSLLFTVASQPRALLLQPARRRPPIVAPAREYLFNSAAANAKREPQGALLTLWPASLASRFPPCC